MPRMYSATGQSRWPWVIGAAATVVVIGGGVAFTANSGDDTATAPSTSAAPVSPAPTSTSTPGGASGAGDDEDASPPTGCLGGPQRNAAMVLAAQKSAGHSSYGAVEVATAFYRFIWQSPVPSSIDVATVEKNVFAEDAPSSFADLEGTYKQYPNLSNGDIPDGTKFSLSTTNGLWMIDPNSTNDRVTVNIAAGYVVDGALSPTRSTAEGFVMQWEDGAWHVVEGSKPDAQTLANGGVRYTGGC